MGLTHHKNINNSSVRTIIPWFFKMLTADQSDNSSTNITHHKGWSLEVQDMARNAQKRKWIQLDLCDRDFPVDIKKNAGKFMINAYQRSFLSFESNLNPAIFDIMIFIIHNNLARWLDSIHISIDVLTGKLNTGNWKHKLLAQHIGRNTFSSFRP